MVKPRKQKHHKSRRIHESYHKLDHGIRKLKKEVFIKKYPNSEKSDFDICFSPRALKNLVKTVGSKVPETGAKGFTPVLSLSPEDSEYKIGFDIVEFDKKGSENATGTMYSPDVEWGTERVEHHMDCEEPRIWSGDIHSHPGKYGTPSPDSGDGLGDLGYVKKVFENFPFLKYFLLPIITIEPNKDVVIHPWVIDRERPDFPLIADVKVCHPSLFPVVSLVNIPSSVPTIEELYDALNALSDKFTEMTQQNTTLTKRLIEMQKSFETLVEKIDHLETSHYPSELNANHIENLAENVIPQTFSFIYSLTPINPCLGSLDDSTKIIEFTGE